MQMGNPRWPPGAVTKKYKYENNNIPLSNFVPVYILYEAILLLIFCNFAFQDGRRLSLLK